MERQIYPDLPICRFHDLPKTWLARSRALPNFRRLKSALRFSVINYGLKSIAWFILGFFVINYNLKPVAMVRKFLTFRTHSPPLDRLSFLCYHCAMERDSQSTA